MSVLRVIIDVDTGVDDAWALLLLLASKHQCNNSPNLNRVNILGITCSHGNATVDDVCRNTLRILEIAERLDIPVYRGATKPFIITDETINIPEPRKKFFGINGFGDVELPEPAGLSLVKMESAVAALNRIATDNKGAVSLLCLAPLTTIALAIRTYPEFINNVKDIFVMGGNITGLGNTTRCAEFNFYTDPEAAHIVLSSGLKNITLLPWETCLKSGIDFDWRYNHLGVHEGAAIQLMNHIERPISKRARSLGYTEWLGADQILAALLLDGRVALETERMHATVELAGNLTRGQVVIDHIHSQRDNVTVVKAVDTQRIRTMLLWVHGLNCIKCQGSAM